MKTKQKRVYLVEGQSVTKSTFILQCVLYMKREINYSVHTCVTVKNGVTLTEHMINIIQ